MSVTTDLHPRGNNYNGIAVSRLTIPITLTVSLLLGAVGAAAVIGYVRSQDVEDITNIKRKIAQFEAEAHDVRIRLKADIDALDKIVLGDKFPGWHRHDMFMWCLLTERINRGWICYDPYQIPKATQSEPGAFLRPWATSVNRAATR